MFSLLRRLTWEDDLEGLDLPPKLSRAKKGNQLLIEKRISLSKSFPPLFGILGFYLLLILVLPGCLGKEDESESLMSKVEQKEPMILNSFEQETSNK